MTGWLQWDETTSRGITFARGFRAAAVRCGLKSEGDDLALIACDAPAAAAGVFTTNRVKASCVTHSQQVVHSGVARAIVCNAGNANCCNGDHGTRDTLRMAALAGDAVGAPEAQILVASTGVIGHPMPIEKLEVGIPAAEARTAAGPDSDTAISRAIITTDTRPKMVAVECRSAAWDRPIRIGGCCKGSGMIAPNMATMLCFLTTDAQIPSETLQAALSAAVERTFNRTTVDGDTSTNDMVLLLASGAGGCDIPERGAGFAAFRQALERVCTYLCREVARDGEGATKLVEIVVRGASTEYDAARIGRTIAESPLVKTALFGADPNWGRILMAAGRAGVDFELDRVEVSLGDICVCREGQSVPFDENSAHDYLKSSEIRVSVDLGAGPESATFWTCDYSYDYIKINAEYHT